MNHQNALLVAAIPGAFITFYPSTAAAGSAAQASASTAKKAPAASARSASASAL